MATLLSWLSSPQRQLWGFFFFSGGGEGREEGSVSKIIGASSYIKCLYLFLFISPSASVSTCLAPSLLPFLQRPLPDMTTKPHKCSTALRCMNELAPEAQDWSAQRSKASWIFKKEARRNLRYVFRIFGLYCEALDWFMRSSHLPTHIFKQPRETRNHRNCSMCCWHCFARFQGFLLISRSWR